MDQMQGVRTIIDRLGLPPRLKILVEQIEADTGPIEKLEDAGAAEIRQIRGMVDGENLLAALVARILESIEVPEDVQAAFEEAIAPTISISAAWENVVGQHPDSLVLLRHDDHFIAFDSQATRIADELKEHTINLDRRVAISLAAGQELQWAQALANAGLADVLLVDGEDTRSIGDSYQPIFDAD